MGPMKRQIMAFVFGACFSGAATLGIGAGPPACGAEDALGTMANRAVARRTLGFVTLISLHSDLDGRGPQPRETAKQLRMERLFMVLLGSRRHAGLEDLPCVTALRPTWPTVLPASGWADALSATGRAAGDTRGEEARSTAERPG